MLRNIASLVLAWTILASPLVQAQPTLSHVLPSGFLPGQTTEVTLYGTKLEGDLRVWSSFPAKIELMPVEEGKKDVTSRQCKVTVEGTVSVGIGGLIVGDATGSSDVVLVMVDDLPSIADNGQNHAVAQAQAVSLPAAVDGSCDGTSFDYYKFSAKKDQQVSVEAVAARCASTLDPVLRLLDSQGNELLLADDDVSFGADSRFALSIPADGDYLLEIRDNQFRAGGRYRLRIGDFPLVSAPYPLGGRFGSTMRFQFTGPAAASAAPVYLRLPDEVSTGRLPIAARLPSGKSSAMATIVTSELPDIVESEPNDAAKTATLTSLPCAINGTFHQNRDRDYYQFAATKGQSMRFQAVSRSMGSPSYLFMRLFNAEGSQVAETAINDADETQLTYTFPADGMYGLMVEDLLGRGGPEFAYRVQVQPNEGFSLALKNDKDVKTKLVVPMKTGGFAVTVQVDRRGYDGEIRLSLESSSAGWKLLTPVIPAKAKEHRLIVGVPGDAVAGSLEPLRILGEAIVQNQSERVAMATTAVLRAKWPQVAFPPGWLDGLMVVSIGTESAPPFGITSSSTPIEFSRGKAQAQFNVTLERKDKEFKDPIQLLVENLPAGFSAAAKPDKDTYQVTISGPKDAAAGQQQVQLIAYGEFKGLGQLVQINVPMDVKD